MSNINAKEFKNISFAEDKVVVFSAGDKDYEVVINDSLTQSDLDTVAKFGEEFCFDEDGYNAAKEYLGFMYCVIGCFTNITVYDPESDDENGENFEGFINLVLNSDIHKVIIDSVRLSQYERVQSVYIQAVGNKKRLLERKNTFIDTVLAWVDEHKDDFTKLPEDIDTDKLMELANKIGGIEESDIVKTVIDMYKAK